MLLSPIARIFALVTALLALCSLSLQFLVVWEETAGSFGQTIWIMARFFTILTNAMVVLVFGRKALTGYHTSGRFTAGLVLWIAAVGLVYHGLLATLWDPQGLRYYADQGMHSLTPLAVVLWWLLFSRRDRLTWIDPLLWMIWPVLYLAYALIRGASDGIYPYPFLDPNRVSSPQLVWNVSRLMEGFLLGGYLLLGLTLLKKRPDQLSDRPSSSNR